MSEQYSLHSEPSQTEEFIRPTYPVVPGIKWMKLGNVIPEFYISDRLFEKMVFRETLLISTFDGNNPDLPTPIGGLCLDIQAAQGDPFNRNDSVTHEEFRTKKFLVHLSSQLHLNGFNGGSTITSWVDRDLHTLEEKRDEYIKTQSGMDSQTLYMNTQEDYYYLRHNKKKEIVYNAKNTVNLICEGSNFILMRYLAIQLYVGTFEMVTTYINGDLCRNIYKCEGPSGGYVNDTKLDVCKIYRIIVEKCGLAHQSVTLMTLQGQILKQDWYNCNYILQINPLAKVANVKPSVHLALKSDYKKDIELLSRYLDAKTLSEKTINNYMDDCKDVKNLIADYVGAILLLKPENILDFSAQYFLNFSPDLLPKSEYFKKSISSIESDPNNPSQSSKNMSKDDLDDFYV